MQFIHSGIVKPSLEVPKGMGEKIKCYVHVLEGKQDNIGSEQ